jgi:hypothetical protein
MWQSRPPPSAEGPALSSFPTLSLVSVRSVAETWESNGRTEVSEGCTCGSLGPHPPLREPALPFFSTMSLVSIRPVAETWESNARTEVGESCERGDLSVLDPPPVAPPTHKAISTHAPVQKTSSSTC